MQMRIQKGMCKTLLPDVAALEAHQNHCSYVCELGRLTFDSLHKNIALCMGSYTQDLKKSPNCQNFVWALAQE